MNILLFTIFLFINVSIILSPCPPPPATSPPFHYCFISHSSLLLVHFHPLLHLFVRPTSPPFPHVCFFSNSSFSWASFVSFASCELSLLSHYTYITVTLCYNNYYKRASVASLLFLLQIRCSNYRLDRYDSLSYTT